jgi:uncharacterized glyoxalase superfamily protein PhnB
MAVQSVENNGGIIPTMRYRDPKAAVDFLCRAFGFERHFIVDDGKGGVEHAELSFGRGMIMLGSVRSDVFGKLMAQPDEIGGRETTAPYIIIDDAAIEAHYARAMQAGAKIVMELEEQDYGGRNYTCRDPEGHVWSFGSYDPWAAPEEA